MADQARLRNENSTKYQTGSKALVPLNLGSCILYDKNLDHTNKRTEWFKGLVMDIDGPGRKYKIEKATRKRESKSSSQSKQ